MKNDDKFPNKKNEINNEILSVEKWLKNHPHEKSVVYKNKIKNFFIFLKQFK